MRFAFMCRDRGGRRGAVVIIGAGPAGLAAAGYLSCQGYEVDVYDKLPYAGGLMMFAIPGYRIFPDSIIEGVEDLRDRLSVKFVFRAKVFAKNQERRDEGDEHAERVVVLEELIDRYDAVLIATGTWRSRRLGIEGENAVNVVTALEYLYMWRLYEEELIDREPIKGRKVVVIGAGLSAVDAAEKALESGAEVYLTYRRSIREAPAGEYPIASLIRGGVVWVELVQPVRIVSTAGFASGVEFVRMEFRGVDESGRPKPAPVPGTEFTLEADLVVEAVGETPTPPFSKFSGVEIDRGGQIVVDKLYRTGIEKVFAAGDVISGPTYIGRAFGSGLRAARSIDMYLTTKRFR